MYLPRKNTYGDEIPAILAMNEHVPSAWFRIIVGKYSPVKEYTILKDPMRQSFPLSAVTVPMIDQSKSKSKCLYTSYSTLLVCTFNTSEMEYDRSSLRMLSYFQ